MEQMRRTAAEVLGVIEAALASIDHSDRLRSSASERVALMGQARRVRDRVSSLACVLTAEADLASLTATGTPLTTLIQMDEGRDSGDAAKEVFQAREVNKHDDIRDAALSGRLSPQHAAASCKGLDSLPDELTVEQKKQAEQSFIRQAAKKTPRQVKDLAAEVLAEVAPELVPSPGDEDAALVAQARRARTKRSMVWGDDGDGSTWFRVSLPHVEAAPLIAVVEAYVESDRHAERDRLKSTRATKPHPQVVRDQVIDDNHRTPEQRRADALTRLVAEHRGAPTSMGDRPRIVVTIREQDLKDRAEKAGKMASGAKVSAGELRRLCCDPDLMAVVLGGDSEILDVGRTYRLVTPAIRRALTLRDGGCVFQGCMAADASCEAHHITPWAQGGETALHNLVLLCVHHHRLVEPNRFPTPDERPGDNWIIHIDRHTGQTVLIPPGKTEAFCETAGVTGSNGKVPPNAEDEPGRIAELFPAAPT